MSFIFGGDSSPPPAPDYAAMAKEQGLANIEAAKQTAYLSNPNISNPYGKRTVTYNTTYATPEPVKPKKEDFGGNNWAYVAALIKHNKELEDWKASGTTTPNVVEELTPQEQAIFDTNQQVRTALGKLGVTATGRVQDVMSNPFQFQGPDIMTGLDLSNVAKMPVNAGTTGQQAIMSRLQPQLETRREALRTSLINQGVPPGSEAYQRAMLDLSQQENDLVQQAALEGIKLDTAANQIGFGQALQSANFGNTANEQAFQRQLGLYNLPLNQVSAFMSGSQVNVPQFQGYQGAGVTAAPLFQAGQAQYQSALDAYNAKQAGSNALMGGLFDVAGAALGGPIGGAISGAIGKKFSDRRLKRDIEKIGALNSGLNLYKYKYIWDDIPQIGVMADEVRQVSPKAVSVASNGYDMVDYSKLV